MLFLGIFPEFLIHPPLCASAPPRENASLSSSSASWRENSSGLFMDRRENREETESMSAHTYKLIELVGSSPISSDEAVKNAVTKASLTEKNLRWLEVVETRAHLEDGKIAHWQVTVKIGVTLD